MFSRRSPDAGVVLHVADLDRHSAQQVGIDVRLQHRVAAKRLAQFLLKNVRAGQLRPTVKLTALVRGFCRFVLRVDCERWS